MKRLTRDEVLALLRRIRNPTSEAEQDELIWTLEDGVPHPRVADLIYFSDPELTDEQIADEALNYQPLVTPPPTRDD